MGHCFKCQAETENHCSVCGAYICQIHWNQIIQGHKDRIKGTATCGLEAIALVQELVDPDMVNDTIMVIPPDPPPE